MFRLAIENGICKNREDVHFEAKEAHDKIPDNAYETYSAFANTDGGTIVFGLHETDDHELEIVGVPDAQNKLQNIWNTLNNPQYISSNILRDKDLYTVDADGKTLIIMDVPRADRMDRPVYLKNNTRNSYRRNGEGDYKCTLNEINSMISDSRGTTTDLRAVFTSDVDDFDKDTVDAYRSNFRMHSIDHPWNDLDDAEFLKLVNATVDVDGEARPSLAGLLMFGKEHNIVREFPDYQLEFRVPDRGNMGWKDRIVSWDGTWPGNVFGFYSRVMSVLMSMNPKPRDIGDDMVRVANTDLDRCMREMLVNALVNADYSQPCGVAVVRDAESLSVKNPGWFRIPVSKALEGGSSDQRNRAVGKML